MSSLVISELAIYPVKSMRQVMLEKSSIDMGGLKHDRRWMVVDSNGRVLTQRELSRLSLIQPTIIKNGVSLIAEGMSKIDVVVPDDSEVREVSIWSDTCNAYDAGEKIAQWLSDFLNVICRLVYFPDKEVRVVDQNYAQAEDRTAFSDGFPVLLISQASLDDLNSRLTAPIPMARFRPNIVVSGCEAFAEDSWKNIVIGNSTLRIVKPCARCVIPTIDIEKGERCQSHEPTKTLSQYRRRDNKILFGQNAIFDGEGDISTGMAVRLVD